MTAQVQQNLWPSHVSVHAAAELFPLMEGERFVELVEDVRANGLLEPIARTPAGEILDGRNRLRACAETGTPVRYIEVTGDPWKYVISANLHRRHLTDTQRAWIAARIAERTVGRPRGIPSSEGISHQPPTTAEAAQLLQVSRSAMERARRVQKHGTASLAEMVETGKLTLHTADRVAMTATPEEQEEFVRKVDGGMNPSTAAPRPVKIEPAPATPKRKRTRPTSDTSVIGCTALAEMALEMAGLDRAMKPVTAIDPAATANERAAWVRDFSKGIQALVRLRKLIKGSTDKDKDET